jgi:hypothetical protein
MNKLNTIKISTKKVLFIFLTLCILSSKVFAQTLNVKQKDNLFLVQPGKDRIKKIKKSFAKTFKNFTSNDVSLLGSLNLAKQNINDKGITTPVNYIYNSVNSNLFKPGFSGGFRLDGIYKEKHLYTFGFAINKISSGANYKNKYTKSPFLEEYTRFKADNKFTTLSLSARYKKLLPINDMKQHKFYAVVGPSIDYRISAISNDNSLDGAKNSLIVNADIGSEFDNNGYYVLFAHYKLGNNLFRSMAPIQLNRFEIGISFKIKDIF